MIHQGQNVYGIVKIFLVLRPVYQEAYAEECFAYVRWGETIPYDHTKRLQYIYIYVLSQLAATKNFATAFQFIPVKFLSEYNISFVNVPPLVYPRRDSDGNIKVVIQHN